MSELFYKVINQIADQAELQVVVNTVKNWSDIDKCKMVSYYLKNPIITGIQYHIIHENKTHIP